MKKEIGGYLELEEPAGQDSAFVADGSTQV